MCRGQEADAKELIESFGETLTEGKKERAQDGFSASYARLRILNMDFEGMIWRNSAGKPL